MTAFFSSGWNGMSTIDDLERGVTDRLLVTPARRWPLIVGRLGQNAVQALIQSIVIIGMALAIGVSFDGGVLGVAALVVAGILLGTAFAALSNALPLVARQEETLIGAVTFLQLPLTFLSTAFIQEADSGLGGDGRRLQPGELGDRGRAGGGPERDRMGHGGRLLWASGGVCGRVPMLATRAFRAYQSSV